MTDFLLSLWDIVLEMSPYLLLGFLVAGMLHAFVPAAVFQQHLARPGVGSVLKATLLGIPLPLCSCGVIPTTVSLRRSGASPGACTAFLIATPQTGVDSIMATWSLLGPAYAVIRPVAALVTGVVGGVLTPSQTTPPKTPPQPSPTREGAIQSPASIYKANQNTPSLAGEGRGGVRVAFSYAFGELLEDVGRWLVVGLIVAALITRFVPEDFFLTLHDYPLLNMFIVLIVAVPMYVCATGSIPIAMALLAKGMTPGAALVLLMAGPAVNAASLLVVGKALGRKNMMAYLLSVIIGALCFGLLIDYALPPEWFHVTMKTHHGHDCCGPAWWQIGSSVLFLLLLARALWHRQTSHHCHCAEGECECAADSTVTLQVSGMRCSHCAAAVERALKEAEGVERVTVDLPTGKVSIEGKNLDNASLRQAVESVGYKVEG